MHRSDWQAKSAEHVGAAEHLLTSRQFSCAYYIAGLAVECALKACIARRFKRSTWPSLDFVQRIHTHDMAKLVQLAGLEADRRVKKTASHVFQANWPTVRDWNVASRFGSWSFHEAADTVGAATATTDGVLPWVRLHR